MKRVYTLIVAIWGILFFSTTLYSKGDGSISGIIINEDSKVPVEFANVYVNKHNDSLYSNGDVSDSDGYFKISNLAAGEYTLFVYMVGYQKRQIKDIEISDENKNIKLNIIALKEAVLQSSAVEVIAEKSQLELSLDKKIYNVGKDLLVSGKSAAEVLDNIPSVAVDMDGNVTLRGSQNVKILVDGKQSGLLGINSATALRQFPANLIKTVEIITNPSARYDAEGTAGIINIKLREDKKQGINGSFDLTAGNNDNYGGSINLNYRKDDFNLFVNYGLRYRNNPGFGSIYQEFFGSDTTYLEADRTHKRGGWFNSVRTGMDYFFNEKNILTGSFIYKYGKEDNWAKINFKDFDANKNLLKRTYRNSKEGEEEKVFEYNLRYKKLFDKKEHVLTIDATYQGISEHETADIIENSSTSQKRDKQYVSNLEEERDLLIQADYILPFNKKGIFEAGLKSNFRDINNDYYVERFDLNGNANKIAELTNNLNYKENIHALYAIIGNKQQAFSWQLGMRAEFSDISTYLHVTNKKNDRTYIDIFPTVHISYDLTKVNALQLSYSKRLKRPRHRQLNPFSGYEDARNLRRGNPDLNPEYTHAFEVGHIRYWEKISFGSNIYYQYSKGVIQNFQFQEDTVMVTQPMNLSNRDAYGVEAFISYDLFSWWKLDGSYNYYRAITDGANLGAQYKSDTYSWFSRLSSKIEPIEAWEIQTRLYYHAPEEMVQGKRKANYYLDFGTSYDVFAGKGTLTFNIKDVLNSRKRENEVFGEGFYALNTFQFRGRQILFGFTYRLNQEKKRYGKGDAHMGD